jgi:hypothetical protein
MIKVKMIEVLNSIEILTTIGNYNDKEINIKFKYKLMMLLESLLKYQQQYVTQMQNLINEYEIGFDNNGNPICENEIKLKDFLNSKYELENMDLEVNQNKIMYDKTFSKISFNQMLVLKPFFDYSEIM